jgi:hypothetical protein
MLHINYFTNNFLFYNFHMHFLGHNLGIFHYIYYIYFLFQHKKSLFSIKFFLHIYFIKVPSSLNYYNSSKNQVNFHKFHTNHHKFGNIHYFNPNTSLIHKLCINFINYMYHNSHGILCIKNFLNIHFFHTGLHICLLINI